MHDVMDEGAVELALSSLACVDVYSQYDTPFKQIRKCNSSEWKILSSNVRLPPFYSTTTRACFTVTPHAFTNSGFFLKSLTWHNGKACLRRCPPSVFATAVKHFAKSVAEPIHKAFLFLSLSFPQETLSADLRDW